MSENLTELPAVARNVNMPCKKCGVDRFFVVLAHKTSTTAQLKCEVCGAKKTLKIGGAAKKPAAAKKPGARTTRSSKVDHGAVWGELKTKIGLDDKVTYNMRTRYSANQAIEHAKFGIGFVTVATNEKIDVTFAEGPRTLVHNRP